jgi:hypothetical protein
MAKKKEKEQQVIPTKALTRLTEFAKKLRAINAKFDKLEADEKKLNEDADALNDEFVEYMELNGLQKFTVKGVGTCYIAGDIYPQVKDVEKMHAWLKDNGFGDMIKPTVNHNTLKAFCKEQLEAKNKVPAGVKVFPKSTVRILKR